MSESSGNRKDQRQLLPANLDSTTGSNPVSQRREEHHTTPNTEPVDLFSSFIFDPSESADSTGITGTAEEFRIEGQDMTVDDLFSAIDPQRSYRDDDLDFFNFLDTSKDLSNFPHHTNHALDRTQETTIYRPTTDERRFPPSGESHRGIVMPANITSNASTQPRNLAYIAPNPQAPHSLHMSPTQNVSASHPTMPSLPPSAFDTFTFSNPLIVHSPSLPTTQSQLQTDPFANWTFDSKTNLDDLDLSPFSEGMTPATELAPFHPSTSASPTITLARRKGSLGTPTTESPNPLMKPTKTSHNMIEKRYRLKLNDKILSLRNAVPALRADAKSMEDQSSNEASKSGPSSKLNKGTVLTKATEYIKQLEREKRTLEQEVASLKDQLAQAKHENPPSAFGQGFDWGGVAPISSDVVTTHNHEKRFIVPVNGMISPESCTSVMSPEAEGSLFADALPKLRPRKRMKVEAAAE